MILLDLFNIAVGIWMAFAAKFALDRDQFTAMIIFILLMVANFTVAFI